MLKAVGLKPEQIVAKLREIEVKIGQGKDVLSACREAGATDKSYYRWMDQFLNAGHTSLLCKCQVRIAGFVVLHHGLVTG